MSRPEPAPSSLRIFDGPKVPEVFLLFWVAKLLTTGIGESGADYLAAVSLPVAALLGTGGFAVAIWLQLRANAYSPVRYWLTVLMVAVFGTMVADGPHRVLGTPYYLDSGLCFIALCLVLGWWQRSEGTISVHSITTSRRERFYWCTVLLTFGLGTAVGDMTAVDFGLGFGWSIALFGVLILVPLGLWRLGLDATVAFWSSYVLTRPLGASIADWLGKPSLHGGINWGDGRVTLLGLGIFVFLVGYLAITHSDAEGAHAAHQHGTADDDDLPELDLV